MIFEVENSLCFEDGNGDGIGSGIVFGGGFVGGSGYGHGSEYGYGYVDVTGIKKV